MKTEFPPLKTMKIAVFAGDGASGGLKGYIKGFLSACSVDTSVNVSVICTSNYAEYIKESIAENVKIIVAESSALRLKDYIKGNSLSSEVIKIINEDKPDIVYFMNSVIPRGTENYVNIVGMHNQLYIDKEQLRRQKFGKTLISLYIQRHFALKSIKKADAVVFDSNHSLKQCCDNRISARKPIVALFGVEESERNSAGHKKEIGNPIELLYISTIFPYKNQIDLVKGISILKGRGYNIKLHLVGSGPQEYVDELKIEIQNLGLIDNVTMHSWVEHTKIKTMIDETDIFIYASAIETSGFGLMEGMVRGAVIACNKESCMPEILGDGGLLFDVHDSQNTADVLERLIKDSELRELLSSKALATSEKYTWKNHARVIFDSFNQVLDERKTKDESI